MNLKKIMPLLFLLSLLQQFALAQEQGIDELLNDIEKKTDLSEKTKLANGGITFIYTRDDLNRMQLSNLKDIIKSIYPVGYDESVYGVADPMNAGNIPFSSSKIKVFIDNQEVTVGTYGSGLAILGNINIDFVDHIEIYTQSPTYEYTTEVTSTLIKLYTKSVAKDEGGKIKVFGGSYGDKGINGYYASYLNDWSYFIFHNAQDEKRKKYQSHQTTLSRDKQYNFTLATLHKDNTNILLSALNQKNDAFINMSLDATPSQSDASLQYIHLGVDTKIDDFTYLFTLSNFDLDTNFEDNNITPIPFPPFNGMYPYKSINTSQNSRTLTLELKYNKNIQKHSLTSGIKYRKKQNKWNKIDINGISTIGLSQNDDKGKQTITTLYAEDQYALQQNSIINLGVEYSKVDNKYSPQNDKLWMYRLGHTYTTNKSTFKTIFNHSKMSLDAYFINSNMYLSDKNKKYKPEQYDGLLENIIYQDGSNRYEFLADYTYYKNALLPLDQGKIKNYDTKIKVGHINFMWTKEYNKYDKLFLSLEHLRIKDSPIIKLYRENTLILRNINTYDKFDIFNEIKYSKNNTKKKNFYNYSAGVKYHYNNDLTINLKGTNLFNKAKTSSYTRINPLTFKKEDPLYISPIDKKIILSVEWVF